MKISRSEYNPIITLGNVEPSRDDFEVIGVFNAGVARLGDEILLLLRVAERPVQKDAGKVLTGEYDATRGETVIRVFDKNDSAIDFSDPRLIVTPQGTCLSSISHLRLARSKDGVHFSVEAHPSLEPATEYETFGLEDPRVTQIGGTWYVQYVAVSQQGVTTCLACTTDFQSFERCGILFCPDNKDVAILPGKIDGRYYALHRPASSLFARQDIWIAESPDLQCWGRHQCLMGTRPGCWDELKIGAGAVPVQTGQGWLEVYHGADRNNRYCLGAVLLDTREPTRILGRSDQPIFEPEAPYECDGFFGHVVFTCGALCENGVLRLYYGAADMSIGYAELMVSDILNGLK